MEEAVARQAGRNPVRNTHAGSAARLTNFYPRYNGANDQVDRITGIYPVSFQRIVPRYRLSTSETRDLGTGPAFDTVPSGPHYFRRSARVRRNPLPPWQGRRIDLLA